MTESVLRTDNLGVEFAVPGGGTVKVVRGVSVEIPAGSFYGLAGESGSGKSIASMSFTRLPPTDTAKVSGAVYFKGRNILDLDGRELRGVRGRGGITYIFQDAISALDPVMKIGAQLAEAYVPGGRTAEEMLAEVGLPPEVMKAYPHELSGGMAQRVCIAMAMLPEPSLLIADEPTTALDPVVQLRILRLLDKLRRKSGSSLLFITHNLGLIAGFADFCAVMYAGRVVESGSVADVLGCPAHPYTRGLLEAVPKIDPEGEESAVRPIPGTVPPPSEWTEQCVFAARCSRALEQCFTDVPPRLHNGGRYCECRNPCHRT